MGACKFIMGLIILIVVYVLIWAYPESFTLRFWGIPFTSEDSSSFNFYLTSIITFILTLIPYLILNSETAKKEITSTT